MDAVRGLEDQRTKDLTLRLVFSVLFGFGVLATSALAGPPFMTDDPEPTDTGHWEVYAFSQGVRTPKTTDGQAGLDFNFGAAKDLQLTLVAPLDFQGGATGLGDVELAAKYRFLHQSDGSALPDVAFFPRIFTGVAHRPLGDGHTSLLLPLWAEKDFGAWSWFGGGGYQINPGPENRNNWLVGGGLLRQVTKPLGVGLEIYHQSADSRDGRSFSQVNLGVLYRLTEHWSLLGEAGPNINHTAEQGRSNFYVALKADY